MPAMMARPPAAWTGPTGLKNDACRRADQRLHVEEGAGDLGRHPALPVGEEREGQWRAAHRERDGGQDGPSPARAQNPCPSGRGEVDKVAAGRWSASTLCGSVPVN
jgi:hypothetical protein